SATDPSQIRSTITKAINEAYASRLTPGPGFLRHAARHRAVTGPAIQRRRVALRPPVRPAHRADARWPRRWTVPAPPASPSTASPRGPAPASLASSLAARTGTATATVCTPERRTVLVRAVRSRNEDLARFGRPHLRRFA